MNYKVALFLTLMTFQNLMGFTWAEPPSEKDLIQTIKLEKNRQVFGLASLEPHEPRETVRVAAAEHLFSMYRNNNIQNQEEVLRFLRDPSANVILALLYSMPLDFSFLEAMPRLEELSSSEYAEFDIKNSNEIRDRAKTLLKSIEESQNLTADQQNLKKNFKNWLDRELRIRKEANDSTIQDLPEGRYQLDRTECSDGQIPEGVAKDFQMSMRNFDIAYEIQKDKQVRYEKRPKTAPDCVITETWEARSSPDLPDGLWLMRMLGTGFSSECSAIAPFTGYYGYVPEEVAMKSRVFKLIKQDSGDVAFEMHENYKDLGRSGKCPVGTFIRLVLKKAS